MLNDSVKSLVGSVARLESVLQAKLQSISHIIVKAKTIMIIKYTE